jgi:anti-sigma factor RsiW
MIECSNGAMRDQLPDLLHDRLDATARETVAAHVAGCVACARELALLREVRDALETVPAIDVSRIVAGLPAPPKRRRRPALPFRADWRLAAAVAAIAVGVGSLTLRGPTERTSTPQPSQHPPPLEVVVDPELSEASPSELNALLRDLESFDGLPAAEPEPAVRAPDAGDVPR